MAKYNFTVRLDDMHNWLKQEAQAQQRSVGNFIEYVLHLYRQNQNEKQIKVKENISHVWLAVYQAMNELKRQHGLLVSDIYDFSSPDTSFNVDNSESITLLYKAVKSLSLALGYAEYEFDTNHGLVVADTEEKIDTSEINSLIREAICTLDKFCNTNTIDCL